MFSRPGDRSEPPGRHAVDDAGDNEPERHRNEAEEHDQPERIEDSTEQIRVIKDGLVVLQPYPRHRTNAVPAKERVLEPHEEGNQHKRRVHQQRRHDEQPADDSLSANLPLREDPPRVRMSREAAV